MVTLAWPGAGGESGVSAFALTLTCCGALLAMSLVTAIGGNASPGCSRSGRVQLTCWPATLQVQPVPWADVGTRCSGRLITAVVGPVVGPAEDLSSTVAVSVPAWPAWKLPSSAIAVCSWGGSAVIVRPEIA